MTTKQPKTRQDARKTARSKSSSGDGRATLKKREIFLEVFIETGNFTEAAEKAGLNRTTLYRTIENDPELQKAFKEAEKIAGLNLKAEAYRRAVHGTERPVFYLGRECGKVREYSDTLLICLLNARFPDEFRERRSVDVNARVKTTDLDFSQMSDEEILRYVDSCKQNPQ